MPRRLLDTASACRGSPWPVRPRRRVRTFRTRTWIRVRFSFQGSRELRPARGLIDHFVPGLRPAACLIHPLPSVATASFF